MAEAEEWEGRAFPSWNMSSKLFPHPGEVTVSAADPPENLLLREERSRARMPAEKPGATGHLPSHQSQISSGDTRLGLLTPCLWGHNAPNPPERGRAHLVEPAPKALLVLVFTKRGTEDRGGMHRRVTYQGWSEISSELFKFPAGFRKRDSK